MKAQARVYLLQQNPVPLPPSWAGNSGAVFIGRWKTVFNFTCEKKIQLY